MKMQVIFFRALNETGEAIRQSVKKQSGVIEQARSLFVEYGLKNFDLMSTAQKPVGVQLKDESNDPELVKGLCRYSRKNPSVLTFKRSKPLKKYRDRLDLLVKNDLQDELRKILGIKDWMHCDKQGNVSTVNIGYHLSTPIVYVMTHDIPSCQKLTGCVRISDLEYEQATAKPKRKNKKPLTAKG